MNITAIAKAPFFPTPVYHHKKRGASQIAIGEMKRILRQTQTELLTAAKKNHLSDSPLCLERGIYHLSHLSLFTKKWKEIYQSSHPPIPGIIKFFLSNDFPPCATQHSRFKSKEISPIHYSLGLPVHLRPSDALSAAFIGPTITTSEGLCILIFLRTLCRIIGENNYNAFITTRHPCFLINMQQLARFIQLRNNSITSPFKEGSIYQFPIHPLFYFKHPFASPDHIVFCIKQKKGKEQFVHLETPHVRYSKEEILERMDAKMAADPLSIPSDVPEKATHLLLEEAERRKNAFINLFKEELQDSEEKEIVHIALHSVCSGMLTEQEFCLCETVDQFKECITECLTIEKLKQRALKWRLTPLTSVKRKTQVGEVSLNDAYLKKIASQNSQDAT